MPRAFFRRFDWYVRVNTGDVIYFWRMTKLSPPFTAAFLGFLQLRLIHWRIFVRFPAEVDGSRRSALQRFSHNMMISRFSFHDASCAQQRLCFKLR